MCGLGNWDVLIIIKFAARGLFLDSQRIIFVFPFPLLPQVLKGKHKRQATLAGRVSYRNDGTPCN